MTIGPDDPRRHVEAPPRRATYDGLDVARRQAQEKVRLALACGQPEPGIFCRSHPLPDLGEPTEREYRTASPRLGLPVEILTWRDPETDKQTVIHRFRVGVHRDDKGVIVLTDTNGRTYSWKAAVRAGLVKLSRK